MSQVVTTNGDQTITYDYDTSGQFTGADIRTPSADGSQGYLDEQFDSNWQLTSATQETVNGGQVTIVNYGPGWVMTSATEAYSGPSFVGSGIGGILAEQFGPNWQMTSATESFNTSSSQGMTLTQDIFDGNWNFTGSTVKTTEADGAIVLTNNYNASGGGIGGSASWNFPSVGSNSETWTTGSHQISFSYDSSPAFFVTDEAFDNAGHMTGAKIFTYNIQGQAFTQTEADYDASWHLTSWHGTGPGYDQTVNYMV